MAPRIALESGAQCKAEGAFGAHVYASTHARMNTPAHDHGNAQTAQDAEEMVLRAHARPQAAGLPSWYGMRMDMRTDMRRCVCAELWLSPGPVCVAAFV